MPSLNEITFLSTTLQQNEKLAKEFDVTFNSLDKVNMSDGQRKLLLALNYNNEQDKLRRVLSQLGVNPPR